MRKIIFLFIFFNAILFSVPTKAQCPMCVAAVESAMKDKKNTKGKGLNKGILYLLSAPYLAIGLVGFVWYKNGKKKKSN